MRIKIICENGNGTGLMLACHEATAEGTAIYFCPENKAGPKLHAGIVRSIIRDERNNGTTILVIATQSPFVLQAIRNSVYAYDVVNKFGVSSKSISEDVDAILARDSWINPDDVEVLMIKIDGGNTLYENMVSRDEDNGTWEIGVEKLSANDEIYFEQHNLQCLTDTRKPLPPWVLLNAM